jgi:hypothetical protein
MANFNLKVEAITKCDMQPMFPQARPIAIAATTIGKDQYAIGIGIIKPRP